MVKLWAETGVQRVLIDVKNVAVVLLLCCIISRAGMDMDALESAALLIVSLFMLLGLLFVGRIERVSIARIIQSSPHPDSADSCRAPSLGYSCSKSCPSSKSHLATSLSSTVFDADYPIRGRDH